MSLTEPGNFEYHDHICMRWKVDCTLNFFACESPSVIFRKCKINLRLVKPSGSALIVMQMRCQPMIEGIYEIEAFILDKNSLKFHSRGRFLTVSSPHYGEVWSIERKLIQSNMNILATNDMLHFVCMINFSSYRCVGIGKQLDVPQPTRDSLLEDLSADVSRLYKSTEHSDVSLKCGNSTIPAHKFLLSARSTVFAAMFQSDMIECQKGVVDIRDIELPILEHLIKYMYSGKLDDISADTAMQLYGAADKYAVCSLQLKCRLIITRGLTADNACEVLVLADAHADKSLKDRVFSYIRDGEGFLVSDQWREFSKINPGLAVEVYDFYLHRMPPK